MDANPHSYNLYDEEDGKTSYIFNSSNGAVYVVSFDINEYDKYTKEYPHLFLNGYGFGFYRMTLPLQKQKEDVSIFLTIEAIIIDFSNRIGNDVVLLYHCDYKDGKQSLRDKLFRHKFSGSLKSDMFCMDRLVFKSPEIDASYFVGYIAMYSNPNIELVKIEFDACAFNLIQDKV